MKRVQPAVICLFLFLLGHAQENDLDAAAACPSAKQCGCNLNNQISAFATAGAIKAKDYCYAKDCVSPYVGLSPNFCDVSYAIYNACNPPSADDCVHDPGALRYRVFYPSETKIAYSNTCKLPVLIFFHGGGFVDCNGNYQTSDLL